MITNIELNIYLNLDNDSHVELILHCSRMDRKPYLYTLNSDVWYEDFNLIRNSEFWEMAAELASNLGVPLSGKIIISADDEFAALTDDHYAAIKLDVSTLNKEYDTELKIDLSSFSLEG